MEHSLAAITHYLKDKGQDSNSTAAFLFFWSVLLCQTQLITSGSLLTVANHSVFATKKAQVQSLVSVTGKEM